MSVYVGVTQVPSFRRNVVVSDPNCGPFVIELVPFHLARYPLVPVPVTVPVFAVNVAQVPFFVRH